MSQIKHAFTPRPLFTHSTRMTHKAEIKELIAELSRRFDRVRANAAFLNLKRYELRAGDFISETMFMDASDELKIEQSVLTGHAFMVQETIHKNKLQLDRYSKRILDDVLSCTRPICWGFMGRNI